MLVVLIYRIMNPRSRVNSEDSAVIEPYAGSCLCMLKRNRIYTGEKYRYSPKADADATGLLKHLLRGIDNKYQGTRLHGWKRGSVKEGRLWISATSVMKHKESSGRKQRSRFPKSLSTFCRCGSRYVE